MLDFEFYLVNATTLLLWLFQICDHRVLIGLIGLGAICVLVSLCVLAFRLVSYALLVPVSVLNFLFSLLANSLGVFLPEDRQYHPPHHRPTSSPLRSPSRLLDRFAFRESIDTNRLANLNSRLSLPQSLASNPSQWAQLETSASHLPALESSRQEQLAHSELVESHSPLRRSRRLSHLRIRHPRAYNS